VKNLKKRKRQLEREGQYQEAQRYDFFPVSFTLPREYAMFVEVREGPERHAYPTRLGHVIACHASQRGLQGLFQPLLRFLGERVWMKDKTAR
jgi:hypothetical protein